VHALVLSFGIVFVAVLGDKSRLMALALAAPFESLVAP
jgi:putative Ca2+/H+ antiporter (TMEM165/GDT1 family)